MIHLYDQEELNPALRGDISVVDCETGESREITITPKILARYRELHARFCDELEGFCRKNSVSYVRSPIQSSFDDIVLRIFRAGGFVK